VPRAASTATLRPACPRRWRWARAMKLLLDTCFATGDFRVRQDVIDEVF
jgi:hypothetical protein